MTRSQPTRILSRDESERIISQIQSFISGKGQTTVRLTSWWNGELRWARNRIQLSSDRRHTSLVVTRRLPEGTGVAITNQLDAVSLESVVHAAERAATIGGAVETQPDIPIQPPALPMPRTTVWSDATAQATLDARSAAANHINTRANKQSLLAAGYVEVRGGSIARWTTTSTADTGDVDNLRFSDESPQNNVDYETFTQAQCSVTVRHPQGRGSGWAGLSGYDWEAINSIALADRALEKCLASINPVRIEPGRYTVVLEPQAVCDLVDILIFAFNRIGAETGSGPFAFHFDNALRLWRTKLGLQVVDPRITISHDPEDTALGMVPVPGRVKITWIENGILTTLSNDRELHALPELNENLADLFRNAYRMSGGTTSIDEMISTTQRGLLVTRLSNVVFLDSASLLTTGVTRDGLWLIENGRTTKAVNNMRFTESPLFVLNQVDQLGVPVPVFRPSKQPESIERFPGLELTPAIVPPVKANDFSFTSMNDAV